jgi:imidazolonepropionase-like amidohydrolase
LVFGAAGYLWQQPLDGRQAVRVFEGSAFERNPAFSPDGRQLAFVHAEHGEEELKVLNFESQQMLTLASGLSFSQDLTWSPDGQQLLYAAAEATDTPSVIALNLSDGKKEKLTDIQGSAWWWLGGSRPHFSADGNSLYFSGPPRPGVLYRLQLKGNAKPEPVTQLVRGLTRALVSPDGTWLAFQRNMEIWVAPLGSAPDSAEISTEYVREEHIRQLSPEGGDTFAFTSDGSAVIYSAGNRVWQHPVVGGKRMEIPIRLELSRATPPPILLRRVRVLDFTSGGFGRETSLYIQDGRIRWMGSERGRQLSRETVTVDASGRFAIPGLFDLHVHMDETNRERFLAFGVTSVRDTGAWLGWMNALADRSEATCDPLPRYFFSGALFLRTMSPYSGDHYSLQIHNEEYARTYVRLWKEWGAHFIKAYPPLSWALSRALAEEARRLGVPVVGHGVNLEEITKSVILGYWSLEHFAPPRLYDDVFQMLALTGTRWDPTLTLHGGQYLLLRDEPERLNDEKLRAFIPASCIDLTQTIILPASYERALRASWIELLAGIRAAHARGIKLLVGTDTQPEFIGCFYGLSVHWELEFFVQAGIPPLEVLRIATQEAAAAVGAQDDLGTLEPSKLADIVLLDKNPLEDIKNTQTIWQVIKGGWVFDPDKLRLSASPGKTK